MGEKPMTDPMELAGRATEASDLRDRIMNPNVAKSEAEWWASREIERLEACIREMVEWRPIETAPRDGTVVLGWSSFFPTRRPLEVSWDDDRYARKPAPRWAACAAAYNRRAFFEHPLTHWLPLPPAPGAEDE